ncbi:alpha/beta fold hydrolase [Streptomyces sp. NPDC004290]
MAATVSFNVPSSHGPRTVTVSYERTGAGAPLLLLHGIGHHRQAWDPVVDILATERDVIAVDLPGFGASPALPDGLPYDLSTVVPALGSLCEALEIDRPHVAGNSLGGLIALELGREKLVRSVTALSPAGFWTGAERRYAFAASGFTRTSRALEPSLGPTMFRDSMRSISRPALAKPTRSFRWSIEVDPNWVETTSSAAWHSRSSQTPLLGCGPWIETGCDSSLRRLPTWPCVTNAVQGRATT